LDIEYTYRSDFFMFQFNSTNVKTKKGSNKFESQKIFKFSKYKNGTSIYKDLEFKIKRRKEDSKEDLEILKQIQQDIRAAELDSAISVIRFDIPNELAYITQPGKLTFKAEGTIEEEAPIRYNSFLFLMFDFEVGEKFNARRTNELNNDVVKETIIKTF